MSVRKNGPFTGLLNTFAVLCLFLCSYLLLVIPFSNYMRAKPIFEKLGHFPRVAVFQFVSADQKQLVAASLVMKVMMYFGGLMENNHVRYKLPPDNPAMSRVIHTAVRLDQYNMDAYYFAQALLVWDARAYQVANDLLVYGMKYRNWDWYLPFFAGFNSAYFLKNYEDAARYYRLAADLSGEPLYSTLAGRYLQKSGQTVMAIAYLAAMEKTAKNKSIKQSYTTRLQSFKAVRVIEIARDSYLEKTGRSPGSLVELLRSGYLEKIPVDPYGGKFYIGTDGKVSTTSEFTFVIKKTE